MLTKELLRYDQRGKNLRPRFVDAENRLLLNLAEQLIEIYTQGSGQTLEELNELILPELNAYRSPLIAKGLNKLLVDRCQFRSRTEQFEKWRIQVLTCAAHHLRAATDTELPAYRQAVAQELQADPEQISAELYADLPDRQPLESFRPLTPVALLQRYNIAQVQGLLYNAERLELTFADQDVVRKRRFLRYLRFFRLMVHITKEPESQNSGFRISLDGPLSLLQQTQKYGLQLALFFPAVCALPVWHVSCQIHLRGWDGGKVSGHLELDQNSGLVSHYDLSAYWPEEFTLFASNFNKAVEKSGSASSWQIIDSADPWIALGGQELLIPDFIFYHPQVGQIYLELFHRWHATQLTKRLFWLEKHPAPVILGVDRSLEKSVPVANSAWFAKRGFLFNDFPPATRVLKCLEELRICPQ